MQDLEKNGYDNIPKKQLLHRYIYNNIYIHTKTNDACLLFINNNNKNQVEITCIVYGFIINSRVWACTHTINLSCSEVTIRLGCGQLIRHTSYSLFI